PRRHGGAAAAQTGAGGVRRKLEAVALHALVIMAAMLTAAPLLWMVSASFMRSGAATSSPPPLLPAAHTATLEHYRALFTSQSLGRSLVNSLLLAPIYGVFLVRQYALSIPGDLLDAARIDGAGEFRIFRSIVLPTIAPVLVTLGVFTFLTAWNDFMWPLIVLSDDARYTLPVAL